MTLESQQHADNTASKLKLLEDQIVRAKARPDSPANRQSISSLVRMANQLREELVRFRARQNRMAS